MEDYTETLLSQYANSPTITGIIGAMDFAVDPSTDIQNFYDNIWNINSAVGYGLDVWGSIVGVARTLLVENAYNYFGFNEALNPLTDPNNPQPFNQAPFYHGEQLTSTYILGDNQYRQLILVKAFANISNLSVPSINTLLSLLFEVVEIGYFAEGYIADGYYVPEDSATIAYVGDVNDMECKVIFNFYPTAVQLAIIFNSGVFPRACGVKLSYEVTL